jgi:Na+/H+ antiporter NhaD/arsenite permease-like protein
VDWTGVAIFAATWLLVASRRMAWLPLDRPAVVLVGAVACVAAGVLTPAEALAAVDGGTLLLLLAVMGMGAFLAVDGWFDGLERWLVRRSGTATALIGWIVWPAGALSALITNDAVAVLAAPVVLRLARRQGLPPLPLLLALATAVNTGSVATLVGNPQNMLCGALGHLSYREHLAVMGPVAVVGLAMNHAWLVLLFRGTLAGRTLDAPVPEGAVDPRARITLAGIGLVAAVCLLDVSLPWTAAAGFAALMLVHRRDTTDLWRHVDWPLLLFFSGLFVVVAALERSGAPAALLAKAPLDALVTPDGLWLSAAFLIGSNVVSNVPFILVVADAVAALPRPEVAWELLAMASTFAGNLTLPGSVANVIVAEAARRDGGIGFWAHLRVGAPLAVATTAVGTLWVVLMLGSP